MKPVTESIGPRFPSRDREGFWLRLSYSWSGLRHIRAPERSEWHDDSPR